MSYDILPLILISILFIGTFILNILHNGKFFKLHKYMFIGIASLLVIVVFYMTYIVFYKNTSLVFWFRQYEQNNLIQGINLYVDALSMFLILIMSVVYLVFVIFKSENLVKSNRKHYSMITFFVSGIMCFLISGDLSVLYVSSEIMVLSQMFLLKYDDEKATEDNFNYLIFQSICSLFIILGTMILYMISRSFNIGVIANSLGENRSPLVISALAFLLSGYGAKLLFIPFHNILSKLQSNSQFTSSPVTVIGTFIAGIYSLIRISFTLFDGNEFHLEWIFMLWGIIIIIMGVTKALGENSLKKLITYIAISEGGYLILGIGIALISNDLSTQLGAYGALYHMLNVALFVPLLYFCGEVIEKITGTDDLEKMGNFRYKSLLFFICFIIGIFSTMGVPIFNGFVSKWLLYKGLLTSGFTIVVIASVLSILLIFISLIKVLYAILLVKRKQEIKRVGVHVTVKISILFMALMCVFTGLFPQFIIDNLLNSVVSAMYDRQGYLENDFNRVSAVPVFKDLSSKFEATLSIGNEITPLKWLFLLILIGAIVYLAFIAIKFFTGRNLKNQFHEEAVYDLNDEVDGFTSSELIWNLNNSFGKYFKIFKKLKTESLNNNVFILLCILTSLIIYMFACIRLGG